MPQNPTAVAGREEDRDQLDPAALAERFDPLQAGEVVRPLELERVEPRGQEQAVETVVGRGVDDLLELHHLFVTSKRVGGVDPALWQGRRARLAASERRERGKEDESPTSHSDLLSDRRCCPVGYAATRSTKKSGFSRIRARTASRSGCVSRTKVSASRTWPAVRKSVRGNSRTRSYRCAHPWKPWRV